jgi:hypothetical protein
VEAVDEFAFGFGWIEDEFLQRCSHALVVADERVWLVDPLDADGLDDRIRASGSPAGVIQLLDRHARDCAAIAQRLQVPHHVVPEQPVDPFEFVVVRTRRRWREVALWWPEKRVLLCGDALGTAGYFRFRLGRGRLGVHPFLRLRPPRQLKAVAPDVILCGHGRGVVGDAAAALERVL